MINFYLIPRGYFMMGLACIVVGFIMIKKAIKK